MTQRTYSILIVCTAVIASVWVYARGLPANTNVNVIENSSAISAIPYQNTSTGDNWKKLLSNVVQSPNAAYGGEITNVAEDTTLTSQMAKDLLSRYLAIAPRGNSLTSDQLTQVASDTLAIPDYTTSKGVVYIALDVNIDSNTSTDEIRKYNQAIVSKLKKRTVNDPVDPAQVLNNALNQNNRNLLVKLDPTITATQGIINDLLQTPVPNDIVSVHLGLLNAESNILTDLKALRIIFSDPVAALAAMGQYPNHLEDLQNAFVNLNNYFKQKLGQNQ